ncbi:P44/Msp2 family outer membrane protein [Anaplasma centrale]|uniref:P44/Msp2 family outer membrane protein n=1 Tax=Anaplasma centrale TaxID=769 RepID=UPI0005A090CD|nr:P44/Msp2 family outer membrane protein [Anaplasma centrale]
MARSFLWGAIVAGAVFAFGSPAVAGGLGDSDTGFYLGFGLAPSFGGVSDFYAEVPGAADAALPYRKDAAGGGDTSPFDFDWMGAGASAGSKYPIKFQRSSLFGVMGNAGVRYSASRLELEAVRERFPIWKVGGRTWTKGDSLFLLVDDAIVRLATGQSDHDDPAAKALRALYASDHEDFTSLVSELGSAVQTRTTQRAILAHTGASSVDTHTATRLVAAAFGRRYGRRSVDSVAMKQRAMLLLAAAAKVGVQERQQITKLSFIEAALSRIGGHKIEIPAVVANTFGANYCYDISSASGWYGGFSPYGCIGVGMSFVRVTKNSTPRFTYGAKLGVSYDLSPQAKVFVGGAYRRVMDYSERCRVSTLSPSSGYSEYTEGENIRARLSFGLHYLALEAGLRFVLA